jgi:hypothetical protein
MARSLEAAAREQNLTELCSRLREIVPDIRHQYTGEFEETEFVRFWEAKVRALHAFQIKLALDALKLLDKPGFLVDLGDSSGTHLAYLKTLGPDGAIARALSVNLDPIAVEKIRSRGGEAGLSRVEDLELGGTPADLAICFEALEHLLNPVGFLRGVAIGSAVRRLLITVPYRRTSRVGLHYLRAGPPYPDSVFAESVHVLELSPEDWGLLCRFAGWRVEATEVFLQYPRRSIWRTMAPLWRRFDFEGFLGLRLSRDLDASDRYADWPAELTAAPKMADRKAS